MAQPGLPVSEGWYLQVSWTVWVHFSASIGVAGDQRLRGGGVVWMRPEPPLSGL